MKSKSHHYHVTPPRVAKTAFHVEHLSRYLVKLCSILLKYAFCVWFLWWWCGLFCRRLSPCSSPGYVPLIFLPVQWTLLSLWSSMLYIGTVDFVFRVPITTFPEPFLNPNPCRLTFTVPFLLQRIRFVLCVWHCNEPPALDVVLWLWFFCFPSFLFFFNMGSH